MLLTFSQDIQCDQGRRIIAGKIVPFGPVGMTSVGPVVFERGSIQIDNSQKIRLLLEHDPKAPLGRAQSFNETEDGIYASFKISNTTRGNDALIEASAEESLRTGLSVGVEVLASYPKGGNLVVKSARLMEVSLVEAAAFGENAQVTSVAASAAETEDEALTEIPQSESEAILDTPDAVAPEAVVETPAVEASRPTVTAAFYAAPRLEFTKEKFLENSVRAQLGDDDARQYIRAAADTTDNAGLVPTRQLTEIINGISNADRPFIDSITTGVLPDAGMTFEIPKITVAPTVAVAAEGGTPSNTDMNSAFVSVNVQKFIGQQVFSLEILDRSSPAFFAELVRQMEFAYAKSTDVAVGTALINGGTDGGNRAALTTGALVADFVSDAAVSIYKGTLGFAQNIVVSPEQWGNLMGLVDSSNRPIFQQTINPQNAGGTLTATAIRGNLLGLNLRVSTALTDGSGIGDNTAIIVNPDSYTWYESARLQLQTNVISTGQVQVAYYGYGAIATKLAAGAYRYMVA